MFLNNSERYPLRRLRWPSPAQLLIGLVTLAVVGLVTNNPKPSYSIALAKLCTFIYVPK